jgi:peptidoglycan/LPS O-acetylase OafA/YrhL
MVVVFHSCFYLPPESVGSAPLRIFLSRLWVGVPIFFVISGYCITATVDSTRAHGTVWDFFRRRARRIFPPYWACFVVTMAAVWLATRVGWPTLFADGNHPIPDASDLTRGQWVGNLTLTETWRRHVLGSPPNFLLGQAWTLCYEEQFYAVCGLLLLFAPRRFFGGVVSVTFACLGLMALHYARTDVNCGGFFFDGHWLLFAAGISVYYQLNYASRGGARLLTAALLGGLLAAALVRFVPALEGAFSKPVRPLAEGFIIGFASAVIMLATHRWDAAVYAHPFFRPVRLCGHMCYSLYLMHWPVTKVVSHVMDVAGFSGLAPTLLLTIPLAVALSLAGVGLLPLRGAALSEHPGAPNAAGAGGRALRPHRGRYSRPPPSSLLYRALKPRPCGEGMPDGRSSVTGVCPCGAWAARRVQNAVPPGWRANRPRASPDRHPSSRW